MRIFGDELWHQIPHGVGVTNLLSREHKEYTTSNSDLLDQIVYDVRPEKSNVWIASQGKYSNETKSFHGGGISCLDRSTGKGTVYRKESGLVDGYCYNIATDGRQMWVSHWQETLGLSCFNLMEQRWAEVRQSDNGIPLGGQRLAFTGDKLWIGQQHGLVKFDRKSGQATLYTDRQGLPGNIVAGITAGKQAIWVSAYSYGSNAAVDSAGIARFALE